MRIHVSDPITCKLTTPSREVSIFEVCKRKGSAAP